MKLKLKTNNTKQNIDFFVDKMFPKKANTYLFKFICYVTNHYIFVVTF